MAINLHDQLLDRCSKCSYYPVNILRPGHLKRQLKQWWENLNEKEEDLFDYEGEFLDLLELSDGEDKYQQKRVYNRDDVRSHLLDNHNDPKCRHIFVQASDSRAPLNCSRESFTCVLAFHQVAPSFLEFVSSFGGTDFPLDYSMTGFQYEDSLGLVGSDAQAIPELGRSGQEIRLSYLLRSAEFHEGHSGSKSKRWPWRTRQMAVYHSFDLVTGRAFWLNIKANDLMKKTIGEATAELPELKASSVEDLAGGFAASLATHLVLLDWCDGNWRRCINDNEARLRKIILKAKTANLDEEGSGASTGALMRALTLRKTGSNTFGTEKSLSRNDTLIGSIREGTGKIFTSLRKTWSKGVTEKSIIPTSNPLAKPPSNGDPVREKQREQTDPFEMFSFEEVQELHHIGERLQEMRLVIQLDTQTLRDIKECYVNLGERDELPKDIKEGCKRQIGEFARKVDRIRKNLEVRLTQLDTMISWLNDGKALFDDIIQFKSAQANSIFAEIAHEQGKKMEKIANKTEQETVSMHIITFVTLVFLPGTFVAVRFGWPYLEQWISNLTFDQTFFQSGLVEWKDNPNGIGSAIKFNGPGFRLFSAICFPMMFITFVSWWLIYRWLKARSQRRLEKGEV